MENKILELPTARFGFATSAGQSEPEEVVTRAGRVSHGRGIWEEYMEKAEKEGRPIAGRYLRRWRTPAIVSRDFGLAGSAGADHFRISVNPTRVLDPDGTVHNKGIEFYKEIFDAAKDTKLGLILCLHHVQRPIGLDWSMDESVNYWLRLLEVLIENFGERRELLGFMTHCEPLNKIFTGYMVGAISPYARSFRKAGLALDNMVSFHEKAVEMIDKKWQTDKRNKPMVIVSHGWIPARRKLFPVIDDYLVSQWQYNWNIKYFRRFVSPEVVLGVNAYALQPIGIFTLFNPSEWPTFYTPYKDPRPEATRIALEQAHRAFPDNKIAASEMGLGEPEGYRKRTDYLLLSLLELRKLRFKLEFIDIWTFVDNMEWVLGDTVQFGVAKDVDGKPVLKESGELLKIIFLNKGIPKGLAFD